MFRTYGFTGKEDLLYRPGRASGEKTMDGGLTVSAIKPAEERPGMVIRLYNGFDRKDVGATLCFARKVTFATYVDLREQDTEPISFDDHGITVDTIGHCKFVSIYIEFE